MKRRILSAIALVALAIGYLPALADSLTAAPTTCPCCSGDMCPMRHQSKPLCKFNRTGSKPCDMKCCQPQMPRGIGATPIVLGVAVAIAPPADATSPQTISQARAIFAWHEVSLPPPRTSLS
jgi:hypothetical protein